MPGKERAIGIPQAELLRARGDVVRATVSFDVNLPTPGARARPKTFADPLSRLGLDVKRPEEDEASFEIPSLRVANVDTRAGKITPVAEWNCREISQADRGSGEHHVAWDIKPGDQIRAVNGHDDGSAMLEQLESAASMLSPKALALRLERKMTDTFGPSGCLEKSPMRSARRASAPAELDGMPAKRQEGEEGRPPKPPSQRRNSWLLPPAGRHPSKSSWGDGDYTPSAYSPAASQPSSRASSRSSSRSQRVDALPSLNSSFSNAARALLHRQHS
eukprot:TRINITY_DN66454_c0_g1_i1.p1 TRINITY_DN66454_c0_g1~~TRINITY_DN66454_c0_g1_i1.p1  ORF type:complete len:275 (-),score=41.50 TRINITY_DN66454_c0_g1_i1:230-1054(-)